MVAAASGGVRAQQPAAGEESAARARQFYEKGMGHFQLEEWDPAIESWKEGFRIKPVPEFLYNIAQAYRLSRRNELAISFYEKYLRMAPNARNRGEVESHIAQLTKAVHAQQAAAGAPPVATLPTPTKPQPTAIAPTATAPATRPQPTATAPATKPQPTATTKPTPALKPAVTTTTTRPTVVATTKPRPEPKPEPKPEPEPRPVLTPVPTTTTTTTTTTSTTGSNTLVARPQPTPIYKKGWFWGVIGGAVVVVTAAVVVGVVVSSSGDSTRTLPPGMFQ
jgi:hypothetical protein